MRLPYRKPGKYSQVAPDPLMTQEKVDELTAKLAWLKKSQPAAAKEVARLAELGDFSENVEYQLAKGRLRAINEKMLRLEYELNHATVIRPTKNKGVVAIGSVVTISMNGKEKTYQILGSTETNPEHGIISYTSPIGTALLGHAVGDTVTVPLAKSNTSCTIIKII